VTETEDFRIFDPADFPETGVADEDIMEAMLSPDRTSPTEPPDLAVQMTQGERLEQFEISESAKNVLDIKQFPELLKKLEEGKFFTETYKQQRVRASESYMHEDPGAVGTIRPPWQQVIPADRNPFGLKGEPLPGPALLEVLRKLDPQWSLEKSPETGVLSLTRVVMMVTLPARLHFRKRLEDGVAELGTAASRLSGPKVDLYEMGVRITIPSSAPNGEGLTDTDLKVAEVVDELIACGVAPPGYTRAVEDYLDSVFASAANGLADQDLESLDAADFMAQMLEDEKAEMNQLRESVIAESERMLRKHVTVDEHSAAGPSAKPFRDDLEDLIRDVERLASTYASSDFADVIQHFVDAKKNAWIQRDAQETEELQHRTTNKHD
jgi:hypothetical protein